LLLLLLLLKGWWPAYCGLPIRGDSSLSGAPACTAGGVKRYAGGGSIPASVASVAACVGCCAPILRLSLGGERDHGHSPPPPPPPLRLLLPPLPPPLLGMVPRSTLDPAGCILVAGPRLPEWARPGSWAGPATGGRWVPPPGRDMRTRLASPALSLPAAACIRDASAAPPGVQRLKGEREVRAIPAP
jgi:hypothetical protein